MDTKKVYGSLLVPMGSIQRRNNEPEQEISENTEMLVSNELLREEELKLEPDIETDSNDPLNLLEIKMEPQEIRVKFNGDSESEFFNAVTATAQLVTTHKDYPSTSPNCRRKRMRSSVAKLEQRKNNARSTVCIESTDNLLSKKTIAPKVKEPAQLVANILDAWNLLFDETILTNVLIHTNDEIRKRKLKTLDNDYKRILDLPELSAWIGLNYLCGIFSKSGATLDELWTPELGYGIFRANMSLNRFEFIRECLRFGIKTKTTSRVVIEIWEQFITNCRLCYEPGANCTAQEHVLDMSATDYPKHLSISVETAPMCCGIRIVSLHDSKTNYLMNALLGKSAAADGAEILALVGKIKNSKQNLILSERYTSLKLAQNLLQYELSLVGCLSPKSKDFPVEFSKVNSRQTIQRKKSGAVFSILKENSESEVLLTSGISDEINTKNLYAEMSQSGERFYQSAACFSTITMCSAVESTTSPSSWTLRFFNVLLDYTCINAWLLFRLSQRGDAAVQQRDFQRQLGILLTQQHLKRFLPKSSKTPLQRKLLICDILGEALDNLLSEAVSAAAKTNTTDKSLWKHAKLPSHVQLLPKKTEKRGRCRRCTWRDNNLTGWQCQQCVRAMCPSHLINRCEQCLGIDIKNNNIEEEQDEYFK